MVQMKKRGLLIDLDGTLINTLPDRVVAIQYALKQMQLSAVQNDNIQHYIGHGVMNLSQQVLAESLQRPVDAIEKELIHSLAHHYEAYYLDNICDQTHLYHNALVLLQTLKARGVPIALITNKRNAHTLSLIRSLNIHQYFDVIMAGEDGVHKPSSDLLVKGCNHLKLQVDEVLMVGDSMEDYQAAQSAGILMVAVGHGYQSLTNQDVLYLIHDLIEILPYLVD